MELKGKQLQLLVQNTKDRIVSVPVQDNGLIPLEIPGLEAIINRDIQRTVAEVERRLKLSLQPKRKTDLPGSVQEVYENKKRYGEAFKNPLVKYYPQWLHLDNEQQSIYNNDSTLYVDGTLPWDLLTNAQKGYLATQTNYVPNKSGGVEVQDGKGRTFIRLYEREIVQIHSVTLRLRTANDVTLFRSRTYGPESVIVYKEEGAIQIFPTMAANQAMMDNAAWVTTSSTAFGLGVPKYPQILAIDYTYGYEAIPLDLMDALAMSAANRVFETVNTAYTKGLIGYSVQGFSAQFGKGMYADTMQRYAERADQIYANYSFIAMTGA